MTTLTFFGAVDTVTGSRSLVEAGGHRVLVDCGLFQGPKKLRERNWREPAFDPRAIDAVVLTHAHIDHSGYLPRLRTAGFTGPVYCTPATRDLLGLLLPDAGHLQEEEAEHANSGRYAHHDPALPLYTRADAERCLAQLVPIGFATRFAPVPGFAARFSRAGHILGAACLALEAGGTAIAFSGDVGRPVDPIMNAPEPMPSAPYLVVESTYGDRRHPDVNIEDVLVRVVAEAIERRGVVVVPAFAVGRAQHLLHLLGRLRAAHRIPECPIYLDSPMAIDATEIFLAHPGDHSLSKEDCAAMSQLPRYSRTPDDSKAIDRSRGPMIVISASGMATGGRVLHHLARFLPDERATILFVGYQAAGTRGRSLVDGAKELKLLGQYVPVRAHVVQVDALSAHADYVELVDWLRASRLAPRRVFVTHGEPSAADAFRRRLNETFGWSACVPDEGVAITLD
ncbi:MAG: MBL fold metallo-hydrolase [Deltaproteobacteria bacterium]